MICSLPHSAAFLSPRVLLGIGLFVVLAVTPPTSLSASAHQHFFAQNSQDSFILEPGTRIEQKLKAGETHTYALALMVGQYVRVEVEQLGIEVLLTLLAPNREKIFEYVAITPGGSGKQIACLVAEQTGNYYIQVREAHGHSSLPSYGVQISRLRNATAQDRERFATQKIYGEAHQIPRSNAPNAVQNSLKKLEAALLLSQKIGDQELEAFLCREIGWRYSFDLNSELKAIEYFGRALQLRRTLGHRYDQAAELNNLGYSHYMLGKLQQAREYYQQSRPIFREIGDKVNEGTVLLRHAMSYHRESLKHAIDYFLQAEPLLRDTGGELETQLLYEMALVWLFLGEAQNAFEASRRALVVAEKLPWKGMKGNAQLILSRAYQAVGDYQKALDTSHQALSIFKAIDYLEAESRAVYTLGLQYLELGEMQRGIDFHQQSVQLHQQISLEARGLRSRAELVLAYCQLGQYQTARDQALSILPLTHKYQDEISRGRTLQGLGQAYQAMGEPQKAIECFEQAAKLLREAQFPVGEAQAIHATGQAYVAQRNFPKAQELFRQSLSLAQKLNNPLVEAQSFTGLAHAERELGHLAEARTNIEAALKITESVRGRVASPALRASFLATRRNSYELYLALLMNQHLKQPIAGHAIHAFEVAERARARSLLESLAEAPAKLRVGVEPALLERERELRQKLSAKASGQNRAASQTEEQAASFSREISTLTAELEQVDSQIRSASPRYAALTSPQPLSTSEIQKQVVAKADTLLLEYSLGEEQSFLWAISANSFNSYELPKGEIIEKAAQRVYDLLTARNLKINFEDEEEKRVRIKKADAEFQIAAAELSQLILSPVAGELNRIRPKQLLIVADGKLQYVPFAALPDPVMEGKRERGKEGQKANRSVSPSLRLSVPLVAKYEIVKLPSASTLAVLRRELKDRKPAPKTLAVFADPVFEPDDARIPKDVRDRLAGEGQAPATGKEKTAESFTAPDELTRAITNIGLDGGRGSLKRLPFSREEANAILKFAPADGSFSALGFNATQEAALKPDLSQFRYVHFATHGLMDNTTPELSGLVLSQLDAEGRKLDGHLSMVEIINMNLPAELVVLSACKTGIGKEVRGEGLMSLTRGFMYAGAARVMVTLWDVNDQSTASLMSEFYRGLLQQKLRPSAALRAAQLKMLNSKQWAAPFYWAAFEQLGEPR